jgi:DNA-binding FadR family transcriptional regulator
MNNPVVNKIREMIEAESFGDSGRLPSERDLARQLGITRSILRKSLSELEAEGLIWRQVGKGTFARTSSLLSIDAAK